MTTVVNFVSKDLSEFIDTIFISMSFECRI